jgi:hypothetical protein
MVVKPYKLKPDAVQSEVRTEKAATELGLSVERAGPSLFVTWNRQAPGVANATGGILTIQELDGRHDLTLDRERLFTGSVVYPATIGDVTFRLQVFDSKRNIQVETFRVVIGDVRRDVAPDQGEEPRQTPATRPAVADRLKPFQAPAPGRADALRGSIAIPDGPADTVFSMYPVDVEALSAPASVIKPEPPPPERTGVEESFGRNGTAAASRQQSTTSEPMNQTAAATSTSAPIPVTPVSPVLPPSVKARIHKRIEVTVTVSVDTTGRVIDAVGTAEGATPPDALSEFVKGAAINAARLWRFEPARANQRNVPGTCVTKFKFGPN